MSDDPMTAKRARNRPRFTLGIVMLLVLALGCTLGWIAHRARVQREAVAAIVHAGGEVYYDYEMAIPAAKPHGPDWLRGLIGRDYFDTVRSVGGYKPTIDDAVVAQIGCLTEVRALYLYSATVTDFGLAKLAGLRRLGTLHLGAPNVSGSGFRHLSGLNDLRNLHVYATPITDENLAFLVPLTGIENLSFSSRLIGDAGMTRVAELTGLKKLTLGSPSVGDEGLRMLGRIGRPVRVTLCPGTCITTEGINSMKAIAPEITITP